MKKRLSFILSCILIALFAVAAFSGCDGSTEPAGGTQTPVETQTPAETQTPSPTPDPTAADDGTTDIGEGETVFRLEVTGSDGETSLWKVSTNQSTVGAALLELEFIAGDPSDYGLYIKSVNGMVANYDTDQSYWAFYVDGEYAMTGVDSTDIEPDKTYALVYTKD